MSFSRIVIIIAASSYYATAMAESEKYVFDINTHVNCYALSGSRTGREESCRKWHRAMLYHNRKYIECSTVIINGVSRFRCSPSRVSENKHSISHISFKEPKDITLPDAKLDVFIDYRGTTDMETSIIATLLLVFITTVIGCAGMCPPDVKTSHYDDSLDGGFWGGFSGSATGHWAFGDYYDDSCDGWGIADKFD